MEHRHHAYGQWFREHKTEALRMIGILYLAAGAVYLFSIFFVVAKGWRLGLRNGGGKIRALFFAVVAALVVVLPVFWDVVPTIVTHQRYCAKDAGLFVYKDPTAWAAQHKAEADALKISWSERKELRSTTTDDGWTRSLLNRSVADDSRHTAASTWLDVERIESRIVDVRTGEVLVLYRDYRAGRQIPNQSIRPQAYLPYCSSNKSYAQHDRYTQYFAILEFKK